MGDLSIHDEEYLDAISALRELPANHCPPGDLHARRLLVDPKDWSSAARTDRACGRKGGGDSYRGPIFGLKQSRSGLSGPAEDPSGSCDG